MSHGRSNSTLKPLQFRLSSLFVLTLIVALLLWAWRFGPAKLAGIIAVTTGVFFVLVWITLIVTRQFR
jgi:membrane protein YdbS with pleckstrin-like domain